MLRTEWTQFHFHFGIFIINFSRKAEERSKLEKVFKQVALTVIILVDPILCTEKVTT